MGIMGEKSAVISVNLNPFKLDKESFLRSASSLYSKEEVSKPSLRGPHQHEHQPFPSPQQHPALGPDWPHHQPPDWADGGLSGLFPDLFSAWLYGSDAGCCQDWSGDAR